MAERRVVKVMWDYEAFPLWVTAGRLGQASSRGVPVSDDLARQLQAWSDELTSLMWGRNGPDARGWEGPDPDDLAAVNARGRALAILVRGELDDSWDVTYFDDVLRSARTAVGLTQVALAKRSGIARPNIATYEHGRREPLFDTAMTLLEAAEAHVAIEPTIEWTWSDDRRPYAIPSRLWRLPPAQCLRRFDPGPHLWWSGPRQELDLALRSDRLRAYELVLREGTPRDIEAIVDGVLLCEAWPDLTLPRPLRTAWNALIAQQREPTDLVAAS